MGADRSPDRRTYIVHRDGRVTHRATGRLLGHVMRHAAVACRLDGAWSAWDPEWPDAIGEPQATMSDAVALLFIPELVRPLVNRRRCPACGKYPLWAGPAEPCGCCETYEQAERRHRLEHPAMWAHYDWIKEMADPAKETPHGA